MPALVFIHGGGWIGGTTYVVENFCKLNCRESQLRGI